MMLIVDVLIIVLCMCRVEELLKERSAQAHALAEVYRSAAEFIRIMSDKHIFQVSSLYT